MQRPEFTHSTTLRRTFSRLA